MYGIADLYLETHALRGLTRLRTLAVNHCNINAVPNITHIGNTLEKLILSHNRIQEILPEDFESATVLEELHLNNNLLTSAPDLSPLSQTLTAVYLTNNRLNDVSVLYTGFVMRKLKLLYLNTNSLPDLNLWRLLSKLPALNYLDLFSNNISRLSENSINEACISRESNLPDATLMLKVGDNPWACDEDLWWLLSGGLRHHFGIEVLTHQCVIILAYGAHCDAPPGIRGMPLMYRELQELFNNTSYDVLNVTDDAFANQAPTLSVLLWSLLPKMCILSGLLHYLIKNPI